jgi:hypothetical protein
LCSKIIFAAVQDMGRACVLQQSQLIIRTHDIDELHAVLSANPLEHLAQAGCGRSMDDRGMSFGPSGFDESERRHRIDSQRRALSGRHALGKRQGIARFDLSQIGVHTAPDHADPTPDPVTVIDREEVLVLYVVVPVPVVDVSN